MGFKMRNIKLNLNLGYLAALVLLALLLWTQWPHECGVCGATIHDYWQVRNDANTAWVEVCELCYLGGI